jgi:hypothetical protein
MELAALVTPAPPPRRAVTRTAIERILHRICALREGKVTPDGQHRWAIALHGTLAFHQAFQLDAGRVVEIACDAELDRVTPEQSTIVARFRADVSTALHREGIGFGSYDDVRAFVHQAYSTTVRDGACVLAIGDDEVCVREVVIEREAWLAAACLFMPADEVSPEWLLDRSAERIQLGFALRGGEIWVETALPLEAVSAQRLVEMIDDVLARRAALDQAYVRDAR